MLNLTRVREFNSHQYRLISNTYICYNYAVGHCVQKSRRDNELSPRGSRCFGDEGYALGLVSQYSAPWLFHMVCTYVLLFMIAVIFGYCFFKNTQKPIRQALNTVAWTSAFSRCPFKHLKPIPRIAILPFVVSHILVLRLDKDDHILASHV